MIKRSKNTRRFCCHVKRSFLVKRKLENDFRNMNIFLCGISPGDMIINNLAIIKWHLFYINYFLKHFDTADNVPHQY